MCHRCRGLFVCLELRVQVPGSTPNPPLMQTSLPDLPFDFIGVKLAPGPRSSVNAVPRTYPRTDLHTMKPWTSFGKDITDAILVAMEKNKLPPGTQFTVGNLMLKQTEIATEEELRAHINNELKHYG